MSNLILSDLVMTQKNALGAAGHDYDYLFEDEINPCYFGDINGRKGY